MAELSSKDIYFSKEYGKLYENNYEKCEEFFFESLYGKCYYVFLKREIFSNKYNGYFDLITPYGYGGPYFYDYKIENLEQLKYEFYKSLNKYYEENKIVSEFVRFHPLEKNHLYYDGEIICCNDTIYMNLISEDQLMIDMDGKTRNMVRKAIKNGIQIKNEITTESKKKFIELYNLTMEKNEANSYYYFSQRYFDELFSSKSVEIFNAYFNDKVIASASILKGKNYIHYHLSANTPEGYKLAANNLLLFEIAKWGIENGYNKFHLGGGYGGNGSPLFKFKKSMAKNNICQFFIGKKIINSEIYDELNLEMEEKNPDIKGKKMSYFPLYRRG